MSTAITDRVARQQTTTARFSNSPTSTNDVSRLKTDVFPHLVAHLVIDDAMEFWSFRWFLTWLKPKRTRLLCITSSRNIP